MSGSAGPRRRRALAGSTRGRAEPARAGEKGGAVERSSISPPLDIRCTISACDDVLPTGPLGMLVAFALRAGFFTPFEKHFHVCLKTCAYTPLQKLQTVICGLATGCAWTKEINHTLRPYPVVAEMLNMPQFPDQSCINRFLHELGSVQCLQLERISELLLHRFGLWRQRDQVDLDIDSTGLMVYGKTYEGMRKGYFPRQRGRRGYRLTVATTANPAGPEILALAFDPANVQPAGRLWGCLYQAADVLGTLERIGVVRADASFGNGADVQELLNLGLSFIVKGISNQTALNFAARVAPTQWESLDLFTQVCDLGPQRISKCRHPVVRYA